MPLFYWIHLTSQSSNQSSVTMHSEQLLLNAVSSLIPNQSCHTLYNQQPVVIRQASKKSQKRRKQVRLDESEIVVKKKSLPPTKIVEQFSAIEVPQKKQRVSKIIPQPPKSNKQQIEVHIDKTQDSECLTKLFKRIHQLEAQILAGKKKIYQLQAQHKLCNKSPERVAQPSIHYQQEQQQQVQEETVTKYFQVVKDVPVQVRVEVQVVKIKYGPEQIKQRIIQVAKVVQKTKQVKVPVEKIVYNTRKVQVPVQKIIYEEVLVERPIDKVVYKERFIDVPKRKYVDRPLEIPVEVPYQKIVQVPVEKPVPCEVEVQIPFEIDVPYSQTAPLHYGLGYEQVQQQDQIIEREVITEVPVRVEVPMPVQVPVEHQMYIPRENIVYKEVGHHWIDQLQTQELQNKRLRVQLRQLLEYVDVLMKLNQENGRQIQLLHFRTPSVAQSFTHQRVSDQSIKYLSGIKPRQSDEKQMIKQTYSRMPEYAYQLLRQQRAQTVRSVDQQKIEQASEGKFKRQYQYLYKEEPNRKEYHEYQKEKIEEEIKPSVLDQQFNRYRVINTNSQDFQPIRNPLGDTLALPASQFYRYEPIVLPTMTNQRYSLLMSNQQTRGVPQGIGGVRTITTVGGGANQLSSFRNETVLGGGAQINPITRPSEQVQQFRGSSFQSMNPRSAEYQTAWLNYQPNSISIKPPEFRASNYNFEYNTRQGLGDQRSLALNKEVKRQVHIPSSYTAGGQAFGEQYSSKAGVTTNKVQGLYQSKQVQGRSNLLDRQGSVVAHYQTLNIKKLSPQNIKDVPRHTEFRNPNLGMQTDVHRHTEFRNPNLGLQTDVHRHTEFRNPNLGMQTDIHRHTEFRNPLGLQTDIHRHTQFRNSNLGLQTANFSGSGSATFRDSIINRHNLRGTAQSYQPPFPESQFLELGGRKYTGREIGSVSYLNR